MKMIQNARIKTALLSSLLLTFTNLSQGAIYYYQGDDANWTNTNWSLSTLANQNIAPGGIGDEHNWGSALNAGTGGTITVNSAVSASLVSGDRASRTLNIESGGSITTAGNFNFYNRTNEVSTRIVNIQSGGAFNVGSGTTGTLDLRSETAGDTNRINVYGTLALGRGFSNGAAIATGATAELNLYSGGTISGSNTLFNVRGGMVVNVNGGSFSTNTNFAYTNEGGTLNINGSGATIQFGDSSTLEGIDLGTVNVGATPTLTYTFGSSGVSAINLGRLIFDNTTDLILKINADALTGITVGQQFLLMDYNVWRVESSGANQPGSFADYIAFTDLGANNKGKLVWDTTNTRLLYEITSAVPEPSTMALLAGLVCLGWVLRRRRMRA